ncbi:hypothetical protein D3C72_1036700 [compost metagenome]
MRRVPVLVRADEKVVIRSDAVDRHTQPLTQVCGGLRIFIRELAKRDAGVDPPPVLNPQLANPPAPLPNPGNDQQFVTVDERHRISAQIGDNPLLGRRRTLRQKAASQAAQFMEDRDEAAYLVAKIGLGQTFGEGVQQLLQTPNLGRPIDGARR